MVAGAPLSLNFQPNLAEMSGDERVEDTIGLGCLLSAEEDLVVLHLLNSITVLPPNLRL